MSWKLRGGHKQETREGYNLLNNTLQSQTINGLQVTVNEDKSVTVVGTTTDSLALILDQSKVTLPAGTYIVKDCGTFIESEENHGSWNSGETKTFTAEATLSASGFYKYYAPGEVVNVTLYPMLIKGSELKPYQPYGASKPSPNHPSEIETSGSNVNYFDKDNVKDEFLVAESGIVLTSTDWKCTDYIEVLKKQYYFSWESKSDFFQTRVCFYDKEKTYISGISVETSNTYGQIIDIVDNAKYIRIAYSIKVSGSSVARDKIKLEIGNKRTLYSSYMCGSVEIDVVNKNLFPNLSSRSVESNGITFSYNADTQEFHAQGTTTSTNFYCNMSCGEMNFLKANKNYIFSVNNSMLEKCKLQITRANVGNNGEIQTSEKSATIVNLDKYIPNAVMLHSPNIEVGTKIDYTFKVQIKEGTTVTDIVEHQSQTAIMPIQQEMLEGDYVTDVEHHEWKKVALTGEEAWNRNLYNEYAFSLQYFALDCILSIWGSEALQICTHFKTDQAGYKTDGDCFSINNAGDLIIQYEAITTVGEWKAYLKQQYEAGTPVTVYYKLAKPLDFELTAEQKAVREQKLYTYKNITNINLSDELASIDVEYKKDQNAVNKNFENRLAALEAVSIS